MRPRGRRRFVVLVPNGTQLVSDRLLACSRDDGRTKRCVVELVGGLESLVIIGRIHQFPYTTLATALAFLVWAAAALWRINVFDLPGIDLIGIEQPEVGEVLIAFLMMIPALVVDRVVARQRRHEAQLHAEQLRVLQVTKRTVQDVVNNNLNQLELLRLEADGHVSATTLALFDETIRDTAVQLMAMGNMQALAERPMATGSGLDVTVRRF